MIMDKSLIYFGYIYTNSALVTLTLQCLVVWTTLIELVSSGCAVTIHESQVARMCYESEATGPPVYIDTSGAKATDNSSGTLCFCNVTVTNAKFMAIRVQGLNSACGSKLRFTFSNKQVESDDNRCLSTKRLVQVKQNELIDVVLEKTKQPYVADFCTKIDIQGCRENQYQCDTTADCIAETNVCDNFPDCILRDDENGCGSGVCTMGMLECKNGTGCYAMSDRCNNDAQCADGTDEEGCYPVVSVRCFESTRFSTTTITTTTSTTTTTTTKTPSTTTPTTSTTPSTTTPTTSTTPSTTTTIPIIVVPTVIGVLLILAATGILLVYMKRRRLTTETKLHEHDHLQQLSEIGTEQGQGHQSNISNEDRDHEIPVNAYERLNMYVNDSLAGEMYQQLDFDKGEAYQEMHYVKGNAGNKDRHFTKQINLQEPDQERTQPKAVSFKEQGSGQETDVNGGERDLEISSNAYERLNLYVNDNLAGEMYEQLDAGQSRDYR